MNRYRYNDLPFIMMLLFMAFIIPSTSASAATLRVPSEYPTIQAAIDAAQDGDIVMLADGTYTGDGNRDLEIMNKAITLTSESGKDNCIIDCETETGGISLRGDAESQLIGITFINTGSNSISSPSTIRNCVFTRSTSCAMFCRDRNSRFFDCEFSSSSGMQVPPNIYYSPLHTQHCDPYFENCVFKDNNHFADGGAVNTFNSYPEFVNCTFENNFASGDGGAVAGYGIFTNCMFIGNEANFSSGAIDGGGTITNCTFENNWAYTQGGAMSFGSGALIDCTFQDNYAADGGAISIPEYGHPLIDRCVFKNNIAERGGAIYSWGGQPVVQNSIFDSNGTPLCHGGVFYLEYYGDRERDYIINISNCLMVNNLSLSAAMHFGKRNEKSIDVSNCILWGNTPKQFEVHEDTVLTVLHCLVEGGYPGYGNIQDDPLFAGADDFHLTESSPCIDAGWRIPAPDHDFDDNPRPEGSTIDIGPFEYPEYPQELNVIIEMPYHIYTPEIQCGCTVSVWNPGAQDITDHPLFVILDVYDTLYFAPDFSDFNSVNQDYPPGETEVTILDPFLWPEDVGSATGLSWYAALVDPSVSNLVSNLSTWEFGWSN